MNLPIRRMSGSITLYRNFDGDQAPALRARLLPQPVRPLVSGSATSLPALSVEDVPGPLDENSSEIVDAFTVDLLSFRSTFTYFLPHLWEKLFAAYRRSEQLVSPGKDRTSPIIDIYV